MKKTSKKTVAGKITAVVMIVVICSLTVVVPCFADYANPNVGSSGMRTYPNTYGIDTLTIRDPNDPSLNGIYATDKYKLNQSSNQYAYDYYDPASTTGATGAFSSLNVRTVSESFGDGYEYYRRDFFMNAPRMLRMELRLDNMLLGVESGSTGVYLPLCAISSNVDIDTDIQRYIEDITYSFTYYNRETNQMELWDDILTTDNKYPLYAVEYENRGVYIRFNPAPLLYYTNVAYIANLSIELPSYVIQSTNMNLAITTYNYGFSEDIVTLNNGIQLIPPSDATLAFKATVYNDIAEIGGIGNFLDMVLNAFTTAEIVPGVAIGSLVLLILAVGVLTLLLKIGLGG